jgi:2-dehydro-3-deoxygluconokinase
MSRILTIGEPMVLFAANELGPLYEINHFTKYLAGSEVNVSIGLKRLNHDVTYVTKLGNDPFGKYIYNFLQHERIDTSHVMFDDKFPTGFQIKSKTLKGDPDVFYFRRGSAASHVSIEDIKTIDFAKYDHIHLTGIFPALSDITRETIYEILKISKDKGKQISFDPNLRPTLWKSQEYMIQTINDIAFHCDIVLPGIQEGLILTGSDNYEKIADFYLGKGTSIVAVKLGENGAFVKTKNEKFYVKGYKVDRVVDTVGAGDGFAVGFISAILEGLSIKEAAMRGNAIGSLQVMTPGDNDGLPNRYQLENYMREKGENNENTVSDR